MTNGRNNPTGLWYRASAKNVVIFVLIWFGAVFPVFVFIKMIHGSVALYLLLVPWALVGLMMLVCPNWLLRLTRASEAVVFELLSSPLQIFLPGFSVRQCDSVCEWQVVKT
jgi:hypothetical protein